MPPDPRYIGVEKDVGVQNDKMLNELYVSQSLTCHVSSCFIAYLQSNVYEPRDSCCAICQGVFIATQLNSTQLTQLNTVQPSQSCFCL